MKLPWFVTFAANFSFLLVFFKDEFQDVSFQLTSASSFYLLTKLLWFLLLLTPPSCFSFLMMTFIKFFSANFSTSSSFFCQALVVSFAANFFRLRLLFVFLLVMNFTSYYFRLTSLSSFYFVVMKLLRCLLR